MSGYDLHCNKRTSGVVNSIFLTSRDNIDFGHHSAEVVAFYFYALVVGGLPRPLFVVGRERA